MYTGFRSHQSQGIGGRHQIWRQSECLLQLKVRIAEVHSVLINSVFDKLDNRDRACDGGDRPAVSPMADENRSSAASAALTVR
jgi:hypothetical protein